MKTGFRTMHFDPEHKVEKIGADKIKKVKVITPSILVYRSGALLHCDVVPPDGVKYGAIRFETEDIIRYAATHQSLLKTREGIQVPITLSI